jgi:hypothetical protein
MRYNQEEEASIASTIVSPSDLVIDIGADLPMEGFRRVTNAPGTECGAFVLSPAVVTPRRNRRPDSLFSGPSHLGQAHSAHAH